jgi:hypothetical protein
MASHMFRAVLVAAAMLLALQVMPPLTQTSATTLVAKAGASGQTGPRELRGAGHRQPEAENLPKRVRQAEGRRTQKQKRFDRSLGICRTC